MSNYFISDNLTNDVRGLVGYGLQLGMTEKEIANDIIKHFPDYNPKQVRLLTKHFYKHPPVPRKAAA